MADARVLGYRVAPMRQTTLLALPIFALISGCGDTNIPNGVIRFTGGDDSTTFDGVDHYTLERIDANSKTKKLFTKSELPETYDMGSSGAYVFRATAFDADGNALARGETLYQDVSTMGGLDIPIFLSRIDRTTVAESLLAITPGEHPKVARIGTSALWVWANPSSDHINTDGYNYAYWQQVDPQGSSVNFSVVNCPSTPCDWQTLVIAGGYIAIAISTEWAIWINEAAETNGKYSAPKGLGTFANVAGGRVLYGANGSAVLIGGAREGEPTAYGLSFDSSGDSSVIQLNTPRAGAATILEDGVDLVVVGGSATGPGVERVLNGTATFNPVNYPPDPVTGAALVREDATHVLRIGGKNADGTPADSVRIDVTCADTECALVPMPELALSINGAQSFFDAVSGDSIIVGEDETGLTVMYRYSAASGVGAITPIAIPEAQARLHATAVQLPNRKVVLVGGANVSKPTSSRSILSAVSF